jgi:hypothetical protein
VKLSAVDRWVIGYSSATSLAALIWATEPSAFFTSHLFHGIAILSALAAARFLPTRGRVLPFLRYGYPAILMGFFYRETGPYVHLFFAQWFDPQVHAFEKAIFGFGMPEAIAGIRSVWLLEVFMFGYLFYYLMLPTSFVIALWKNKLEPFRHMMEAACAVFYASFALFALFPLEGPRHALASVLPPIKGGLFFGLVMTIQNAGSIHGGCMPSSHTAVAWVVTWYVFKMDRRCGRTLMVISTLLSVGCFWGRFHYVTDVAVGLVLFAAAVLFTEWYNRRTPNQASGSHSLGRQEGTPCIR